MRNDSFVARVTHAPNPKLNVALIYYGEIYYLGYMIEWWVLNLWNYIFNSTLKQIWGIKVFNTNPVKNNSLIIDFSLNFSVIYTHFELVCYIYGKQIFLSLFHILSSPCWRELGIGDSWFWLFFDVFGQFKTFICSPSVAPATHIQEK